jgi:hypothetical protein
MKYIFVDIAVILSASYFGEALLPVTFPLAMGALGLRFGSSLEFLRGSGNYFTILLEVPFISLALHETSGLINHQHLILLLDFYIRSL